MISTATSRRSHVGGDDSKPLGKEMAGGGTRALKESDMGSSSSSLVKKEKKDKKEKTDKKDKAEKKDKKEKKVKTEKKDKKSKKKMEDSSSSLDDSPPGSSPPAPRSKSKNTMSDLHASYGSLGGSFNNLHLSASNDMSVDMDEFSTPRQSESPWKVKLKKATISSAAQEHIASLPMFSPLKPVQERDEKRRRSAAGNESNMNPFLLEEFSTPRQSPWRSPAKKVTVATPQSRPPTVVLDNDEADEEDEEAEKIKRKEEKKLKKEKKAEKERQAGSSRRASIGPTTVAASPKTSRRASIGPTTTVAASPNNTYSSINSGRRVPASPVGILKNNQQRNKKSVKSVKFPPFNRVYRSEHIAAATRIAALARGKHGRMQAKLLRLQRKLANMDTETAKEVKKIQLDTLSAKKEFKHRAMERFQKNLARKGEGDSLIHDSQALIVSIRNENADFRERNQKLYEDLTKLKINNERLEESNKAGSEFMDRLVYHDDTCVAENAKLTKIAASYEKAVAEHAEHLEVHTAYGDTEYKMKMMYSKLLASILDRIEGHDNKQLIDDIYTCADELESQWGKTEGKKAGKKEVGKNAEKEAKKEGKKSKKVKL